MFGNYHKSSRFPKTELLIAADRIKMHAAFTKAHVLNYMLRFVDIKPTKIGL